MENLVKTSENFEEFAWNLRKVFKNSLDLLQVAEVYRSLKNSSKLSLPVRGDGKLKSFINF